MDAITQQMFCEVWEFENRGKIFMAAKAMSKLYERKIAQCQEATYAQWYALQSELKNHLSKIRELTSTLPFESKSLNAEVYEVGRLYLQSCVKAASLLKNKKDRYDECLQILNWATNF